MSRSVTYGGDVQAACTNVVRIPLGGNGISPGQLAPVGHHRRQAQPPGAPTARQHDEVLVELRSTLAGSTPAQEPLVFAARASATVGVVGRGQHRVGDLEHPCAVQSEGRVEQHQTRYQVGVGGRQLQGDRASERVRHDHDGAIGRTLEQVGQRGHIGVDRPRRLP